MSRLLATFPIFLGVVAMARYLVSGSHAECSAVDGDPPVFGKGRVEPWLPGFGTTRDSGSHATVGRWRAPKLQNARLGSDHAREPEDRILHVPEAHRW